MTTQEPAVDGRASCVSVGVAAVSDRSQRLPAHALADDPRGQLVGSPAARGRISRGPYAMPSLVRSASRSRSHSASAATRCRNMHRCRSWSRSSGPA